MRRALALTVLAALAVPAALAQQRSDKPVRVAYYYKVRWGFQQEFERLFLKNHYPVLVAQTKEGGRVKALSLYRPTFHGDGRSDWTFLVVITFTDWAALGAPFDEAALARQLFPDQETFRREEQRRFEILEAHWDVPLTEVEPPR